MIVIDSNWSEYDLLDSGLGRRLERFGSYIISRPDPQAIWQPQKTEDDWNKAHAVYFAKDKMNKFAGWKYFEKIPDKWILSYDEIKVWAKLTSFKHTGVFPEQVANWKWLKDRILIRNSIHSTKYTNINILNLFGYTGIASLVCASAGAKVTHVDASRPSVSWAKDNQIASNLQNKPIRWILDDAVKFVRREIKRGTKYDGIIMDPPIYGHGPDGEKWDFNIDFPILLKYCRQVLSDRPLFLLINAYAISASFFMLENLVYDLNLQGKIESGELIIKQKNSHRCLSTGIFARWSSEV